MNRLSWVLVVILAFGAVYACSLTFEYVDGDDASSIAYHALGRDRALQPAYSEYQIGADLILKPLPAREPILRFVAITISSLATICVSILMLALAFDWMKLTPSTHKGLVALVLLLACPELFYLGLVYSPTMIGMSFMLAAHLLLRSTIRESEQPNQAGIWLKMAVAAVLVGFGGACRWNVLLYGGVIFADLLIGFGLPHTNSKRAVWNRFRFAVLWGILALLVWGIVLAASGYGLWAIWKTTNMATKIAAEDRNYLSIIGSGQSMFTPAFLIFGLWGWLVLPRKLKWLAALSFLAVIGVIRVGWIVPKTFLMFVPPLILCVISGFSDIWRGNRPVWLKRAVQGGAIVLVLLPWVFGIHATHGASAWGPGFDLLPYNRTNLRGGARFAPTVGAGAAFPTAEGPRPLLGHAAVLFGGEWRRLIRTLEAERRHAIQIAVQGRMPFLVVQGDTGYAVAELAGMGFKTHDPKEGDHETLGRARNFSNDNGQQFTLWKLGLARRELLDDTAKIREVIAAVGAEQVVVQGYPSGLRILYEEAPEAMQELGPTSAIVNLQQLIESNEKRNKSDEKF